MNTFLSVFAGFLSGIFGSMGFGGGGILIIYLVIFAEIPQLQAQGINLIFFIPCAFLASIIYTFKKQIKYREIYPVIIGGILGAIISGLFLSKLNSNYFSIAFSVFLISAGVYNLIKLLKNRASS